MKGQNIVLFDGAGVLLIKDREPDSVEPYESLLRAHPQITVSGLHYDAYRLLWQSLFGLPHIMYILCDRFAWIEALCGRTLKHPGHETDEEK